MENIKELAILLAVKTKNISLETINEHLDELEFLAATAGVDTSKRIVQSLDYPNPKTYFGKGKLEELAIYVNENEINVGIIDDEISPSQLRNIENALNIKILDRTTLILDIFATRAQTSYAKTQVELAQYQYLLPRLTRMWTHLERQKGGIGMRGPGETQIETDRRIINTKISYLKEQLQKIDRQQEMQRGNRGKLVRVSLVGYTNVGKSTLMNLLAKEKVFAENKLFATLDTTVRKITIKNLPFLLVDTVGFIRKLPHHLVESFKSTLDEVIESDLIMHIIDISHKDFENQYNVVQETIADIKANNIPQLLVFNKIDDFSYIPKDEDDLSPITRENLSLEDLKKTWMSRMLENKVCFISAEKKINIEELKDKMYDLIKAIHIQRFPFNDFLY